MLDRSPWPLTLAVTPPAAALHLDVATQRLRAAIIACDLAPGAVVHERAVAEAFGLGRAAVRVALTVLEASGFVRRQARQGWHVAPVDGALVTAVVAARRQLEPTFAACAPSAQDLAALRQAALTVVALGGRAEAESTARAAWRGLRDLFAGGAGALAQRWHADLTDHIARVERALQLAGTPLSRPDPSPLVEALARGDVPAARVAIEADIDAFEAAVARALLRGPVAVAGPTRRWRRQAAAPAASGEETRPQRPRD